MQRAVLLAGILCVATSAAALYADQAGLYDWTKQHVGAWTKVVSFNDAGLLLVESAGSEGGDGAVIAAVDADDGQLEWRQVFGAHEVIVASTLDEDKDAWVTVSYNTAIKEATARAWNVDSGKPVWEATFAVVLDPSAPFTSAAVAFAASTGAKQQAVALVVAAVGKTVVAISFESGKVKWRTELEDGLQATLAVDSYGGESACVLSGTSTVSRFALADGAKLSPVVLPAGATAAILHDDLAIVIVDGLVELVSLVETGIKKIGVKGTALYPAIAGRILVEDSNAGTVVDVAIPTGTVGFSIKGKPNEAFVLSANQLAVFATQKGQDGNVWAAKVSNEQNELTPYSQLQQQHGTVVNVFANEELVGFVFADGVVKAFNGSVQAWVRDESLAKVFQAEFIDLPQHSILMLDTDVDEEVALAESASVFRAFSHRLSRHAQVLHSLANQFDLEKLLSPAWWLSSSSAEGDELARDSLGTHKLIVLLTTTSRVVAISSWDGVVRWSKTYLEGQLTDFNVLRAATTHDPVGALTFKTATGGTKVLLIDPITGEPLDTKGSKLDTEAKALFAAVISSANADHSHIHPLLFVNEDFSVHHLPAEVTLNVDKPLYFAVANASKHAVEGLRILPGGLAVESTWSLALDPKEGEVRLAQHAANEHVPSIGRVLGDRRVLFKYLNQHLLAVATASASSVRIRLVDSVSGNVLYARHHSHASGPVNVVVSENWVVYSYVNTNEDYTEMVALELFENGTPDLRLDEANFSSFDKFVPHVLAQSYIVPSGITAMGVTQTLKGITRRLVICALTSSQLSGIPKRLLDPRRPVGALDAEQKEEMLLQYMPLVPIDPKSIISYSHEVARVHTIVSAPIQLESNALVLALGLDLFFTRVTPSNTFDSLTDEFSYGTVAMAIAALSVATLVMSQLARRKALMERWK